ncbi:MAG: hypothetical protein HFK07_02040 [Clostridia bacterium]|nr:hypothetical protein [Clostridia bacterium]
MRDFEDAKREVIELFATSRWVRWIHEGFDLRIRIKKRRIIGFYRMKCEKSLRHMFEYQRLLFS